MIRIEKAQGRDYTPLERDEARDEQIERAVDGIILDVRDRGDAALIEYAKRFDGCSLDALLVSESEIDAALRAVDPGLLEDLELAAKNIEAFHTRQKIGGFEMRSDGIVVGQRVLPLRRVGLYVPGGTASYPSSVLMNAVPAKIAGVSELVMATPPGRDGSINPLVLCAARVAGVSRVVKAGGAQAIAALAYGTQSVPRVDKIVGPGNIYVATAKRRVFGRVDIDMIAGPSEILIVADGSANPAHVAADMLSQAEHDRLACAWLLTDSDSLADAVRAELERQIPLLPRAEIARASIDDNGKIILVSRIEEAIGIANRIAPEHLELMLDDAASYLDRVTSAGSVFLGRSAPEALGDYWAGPNHTLPTSGTARFSSPLSVLDFVKTSQYIQYDHAALQPAAASIANLARAEGLEAHARSVEVRFE